MVPRQGCSGQKVREKEDGEAHVALSMGVQGLTMKAGIGTCPPWIQEETVEWSLLNSIKRVLEIRLEGIFLVGLDLKKLLKM